MTPDARRRRLLQSPRFRLALLFFALNFLVGWPAALLLGAVATFLGLTWLGLVGGLVVYAISWIMLGVAVLLGGREVVVHGRWLIRHWMEKRRSQVD